MSNIEIRDKHTARIILLLLKLDVRLPIRRAKHDAINILNWYINDMYIVSGDILEL